MSEIDWVQLFSQFVLGACAGNCLSRLGHCWVETRRKRKDANALTPNNSIANVIADLPYIPTTSKGYRKPAMDNTLGWRGWTWGLDSTEKTLISPVQHTTWPGDGILSAHEWDRDAVVRGRAGIHAKWPVPSDWAERDPPSGGNVVGIVERFGKYVLGEDGWRAEWAVIKELACSSDIIEEVRASYPGIPVRVSDRLTANNHPGGGHGGYGFVTITGTITSGISTTGTVVNGALYPGWSQASGINCSLPMDVCPCPSCTDARNGGGGWSGYPWPTSGSGP